jgi:hypothetical protein
VVTHESVIHLLAQSKAPLFSVLAEGLHLDGRVRWWSSAPVGAAVKAGDVLVVDLMDGGPSLSPTVLVPLLPRAVAWLVTGTKPVGPDWLDLAGRPEVRVERCLCRPGPESRALLATLDAYLRGPTGAQIGALVVEREPRFAAVQALVRILCERPWEARHPGQLAALAAVRPARLRSLARGVGCQRVEHFIIAVRMVAFEGLVTCQGISPAKARNLVGLADPSNAHRQLRRAQAGSPGVFHGLASPRT